MCFWGVGLWGGRISDIDFNQQDADYSVAVYNRRLRKLLKFCGLNRLVPKFNETKGEYEYFPLYELASSRLARNTYKNVHPDIGLEDKGEVEVIYCREE